MTILCPNFLLSCSLGSSATISLHFTNYTHRMLHGNVFNFLPECQTAPPTPSLKLLRKFSFFHLLSSRTKRLEPQESNFYIGDSPQSRISLLVSLSFYFSSWTACWLFNKMVLNFWILFCSEFDFLISVLGQIFVNCLADLVVSCLIVLLFNVWENFECCVGLLSVILL